MKRFSIVVGIFIAIISSSTVVTAGDKDRYDRRRGREDQDYRNNMDRRKAQLESLIEKTKLKLDDHKSGRQLLQDEELPTLEKRLGLLQKKLDGWREPDQEMIDRMRERDEKRLERRRSRAREF
mmetsp:Transcript_2465/g.2964  ORF Transcript_2465/g.2964 Transcript_2465/m.2964 type:complete len:124 (-) Transcript_2465:157-528(-)